MGGAGADGDGVARRDGQLPGAAIVGAPRQLDLDQPVAQALDLVCRDEIPRPRFERPGAAVHHAERGVANGCEKLCIVGIAPVDLHRDVQRLGVEGRDGALRKRERVVVYRQVPDGHMAAGLNMKCRLQCRVHELGALAVDLERVELGQLNRLLDPVDRVLSEIEHGPRRLAVPFCISQRRPDRGQCLRERGVGILGLAGELRHVEADGLGRGRGLRPAFPAAQELDGQGERGSKTQHAPAAHECHERILPCARLLRASLLGASVL